MLNRRTFLLCTGAAIALRDVPSLEAASEGQAERLVAQTDRARILRGAKLGTCKGSLYGYINPFAGAAVRWAGRE